MMHVHPQSILPMSGFDVHAAWCYCCIACLAAMTHMRLARPVLQCHVHMRAGGLPVVEGCSTWDWGVQGVSRARQTPSEDCRQCPPLGPQPCHTAVPACWGREAAVLPAGAMAARCRRGAPGPHTPYQECHKATCQGGPAQRLVPCWVCRAHLEAHQAAPDQHPLPCWVSWDHQVARQAPGPCRVPSASASSQRQQTVM
jgi:hypothetical protein